MKKSIALAFLLSSFVCFGQTFSGKVIDSATLTPIAFANIGILKGNNGTVTTENGNFTINLSNAGDNDTLGFSFIGYTSRFMRVADFKRQLQQTATIALIKMAYQLNEVEIRPAVVMKYNTLGHVSNSNLNVSNDSNKLGFEVGKVFKIKKAHTFIDSIMFFIKGNKCDTVMFRINIYKYKEGGLFSSGTIGENILKQNVIAKTSVKNGFVYVDISKYNIKVDGDFVVSLEWIKDFGVKAFGFSGAFFGGGVYIRGTSEGSWIHISIATIEMAAMVCYPK